MFARAYFALTSLLLSFGVAMAAPELHMSTEEAVDPPIGWLGFCREYPADCAQKSTPTIVRMTPDRLKFLMEVNRRVNREIRPISDELQYGVKEKWIYPHTLEGDCDDYVLLKRLRLMNGGWPLGSLLITVVDDDGEGHAVLTAVTSDGDLILDNKNNDVLPWWRVRYTFIKRQSAADQMRWLSLVAPTNDTSSLRE